MKKRDVILIVALLIFAGAIYFTYQLLNKAELKGNERVTVTVEGEEYGSYALNMDATIEIQGKLGINTLEIKEGKAKMVDADCPDQICVNHLAISHSNDLIICLPNEIIVEVVGGSASGIDATAQ